MASRSRSSGKADDGLGHERNLQRKRGDSSVLHPAGPRHGRHEVPRYRLPGCGLPCCNVARFDRQAGWRAALDTRTKPSLCGGLSGLAFVLNEAGKATGNAKYREAAKSATDAIVEAARPVASGLAWSGAPGVATDGIVLYLLYAADEFQNDQYRSVAKKAGDHILELAIKEPRGGLSWRGFPAFPGLPKDAYFPNFEGGTAGVAYVLTRRYGETKEEKYRDAARQGALHLQTIAAVHGDAALIPYRFPDLTDLYYLGFCHGPAGTARTFSEFHRITGEPEYQLWTDRFAQGVIQSGIPEDLTPGYWNVVCKCCGSATVIDLFLGLWAASGAPTTWPSRNA